MNKFYTDRNGKTTKRKLGIFSIVFTVFFVSALSAYAISYLITSKSFEIPNKKGHVFTIDLSGQIEGIEMIPRNEQNVLPTLTNTGTERMYVFIRFDVATTEDDIPIYSFSTDSDTWIPVTSEDPSEIIYCYGSDNIPMVVKPNKTVSLPGILTLDVENIDFVDLTDNDLNIKVTGCAIGTEVNGSASEVYQEYIYSGGK